MVGEKYIYVVTVVYDNKEVNYVCFSDDSAVECADKYVDSNKVYVSIFKNIGLRRLARKGSENV